jgi:protein-tyrosine phosphatase
MNTLSNEQDTISNEQDTIFPIEDIEQRFPYGNLNGTYHNPESFHMITDTVAIGDWTSSYEPFDVIFNFNYPPNGAQYQQIHRSSVIHQNKEKIIYTIGLLDTVDYTHELVHIFMNLLPYLGEERGKRILFHCYAGISRSTTAAIIYFMITSELSLSSIYDMIVSKRSFILPNPTFCKILSICETQRNITDNMECTQT